jgi:hypothetical protein
MWVKRIGKGGAREIKSLCRCYKLSKLQDEKQHAHARGKERRRQVKKKSKGTGRDVEEVCMNNLPVAPGVRVPGTSILCLSRLYLIN